MPHCPNCEVPCSTTLQESSLWLLAPKDEARMIQLAWMISEMHYFAQCQLQTGKHVSDHYYE